MGDEKPLELTLEITDTNQVYMGLQGVVLRGPLYLHDPFLSRPTLKQPSEVHTPYVRIHGVDADSFFLLISNYSNPTTRDQMREGKRFLHQGFTDLVVEDEEEHIINLFGYLLDPSPAIRLAQEGELSPEKIKEANRQMRFYRALLMDHEGNMSFRISRSTLGYDACTYDSGHAEAQEELNGKVEYFNDECYPNEVLSMHFPMSDVAKCLAKMFFTEFTPEFVSPGSWRTTQPRVILNLAALVRDGNGELFTRAKECAEEMRRDLYN